MALKSSASSSRVSPASTNGKPTSSSAPTSRRGSVDQGVVVAKPTTKLATNAPSAKPTSSSRVTSRPASTNGKPTSSSAPTSRRGSVDQGVVVAKPATKLASPSDKTNNENSKPIAVKEPEPQIILSGDDLAKMKAATDALSDIIEQGQIAAEELREAESYELPRLAERGRRKSKDLKEQAMKFLEEALEPVFKLMDTSGDGQLDQKELKRAFDLVGRPTSDEAIERAIKELDTNNDGLVNLQEFKAIAWATAVDSAPETGAAAA